MLTLLFIVTFCLGMTVGAASYAIRVTPRDDSQDILADGVCPHCGHDRLEWRPSAVFNAHGRNKPGLQCMDCYTGFPCERALRERIQSARVRNADKFVDRLRKDAN